MSPTRQRMQAHATELRSALSRKDRTRKFKNRCMLGVLGLASLLAVIPLIFVFWHTVKQGVSYLSPGFLTHLPAPVGEVGGGMGNALLGTATLLALGASGGVPFGLILGVYHSEYRNSRLAGFTRFGVDLLSSLPSILVGLFVYAWVVIPMKRFSAWAGGIALAFVILPIVARSTEEILKLVPQHVREAGLALGLPRWKVILRVLLPGQVRGLITGVMLALARASGETAPLLFTALNSQFWSTGLDQPISSLPVQIYTYAISPFEEWQQQAWTGAFVLIFFVLSVNLFTRFLLGRRPQ
jgi:phosphate transport system permease protein